MKKLILVCLIGGMLLCNVGGAYGADNAVSVELDGEKIEFKGQQPVIVEGRTLIPLRGVFEKMGYTVSWEGNTKTAFLTSETSAVSVSAGSGSFDINGETKALDVPAQIINGSMLLPLRAIGEAAGASVSWDGGTKTAIIDTKSLTGDEVITASEYLSAYSKAAQPLDSLEELFKEIGALEGELSAEELQSYRARFFDANQALQSVISSAERLQVPESMAELHQARLDSLNKLKELIDTLIDYCDGKINTDELTESIREFSADTDEITKRINSIIENIENN